MNKRAAFFLTVAGALPAYFWVASAATGPAQEPVLIVLYSRFYDHSHQPATDDRLTRLLPLLDGLHQKYPQSGISATLQFSGTVAQLMSEENPRLHLVDKIKDAAGRGLIDVGYTGEDEPSYLYRPQPNPVAGSAPEDIWAAKAEAAARFLTDFKDPLTGQPFPGLTGGLKRVQEVFGRARFVTGLSTRLGGDSAATHELRNLDPDPVMGGIPGSDPRRGIEGYGYSAENFSRLLSPVPLASPEVFWEDGMLRISDFSLPDNRPHSTDEDADLLKHKFVQLDRSHVRVIKLEVAPYLRYLTKRADRTVVWDPMEWIYFHPDQPIMPNQLKATTSPTQQEAGYKNEAALLTWLLNDFLPANPGSRFISMHELAGMAENPHDTEVTSQDVKGIADSINTQFKEQPMQTPKFLHTGNRYYSNAEAFQVLAEALARVDKNGSLPASVKLTNMYGPLVLAQDMGPIKGSVTVADVEQAAARLAPVLSNATWKQVPDNAVPGSIQVGTLKLNPAQFLNLMAWACLDTKPDKVLQVNATAVSSSITFLFPQNTPITEQGNGWTFKPAPLRLAAAVPAEGNR